jgi:hypothetical protein
MMEERLQASESLFGGLMDFRGGPTSAQQVDTINAILPDGPFALGITRPTVNRSINSRNSRQLADAHSLAFNAR